MIPVDEPHQLQGGLLRAHGFPCHPSRPSACLNESVSDRPIPSVTQTGALPSSARPAPSPAASEVTFLFQKSEFALDGRKGGLQSLAHTRANAEVALEAAIPATRAERRHIWRSEQCARPQCLLPYKLSREARPRRCSGGGGPALPRSPHRPRRRCTSRRRRDIQSSPPGGQSPSTAGQARRACRYPSRP